MLDSMHRKLPFFIFAEEEYRAMVANKHSLSLVMGTESEFLNATHFKFYFFVCREETLVSITSAEIELKLRHLLHLELEILGLLSL